MRINNQYVPRPGSKPPRLGDDVLAGGRKGVMVKTLGEIIEGIEVQTGIGVVFLSNFEKWTGLQKIILFKPEEVRLWQN